MVLDDGRVVHLNQIKAIYTAWGESLLLGGRRFYFIELPGLFWSKRVEVSSDDYERLLDVLESRDVQRKRKHRSNEAFYT